MMRTIAAFSLGGLLAASIALAGCSAVEKTGEVGNKNLRPYTANDHEKHGLPLNGVHSFDSPTYRLRSDDRYNHQDTWMLRNRMGNNLIGAHGNDRLEMDPALANRLEALPGVKKAYVLLAGERAYVGIKKEDGRQGTSAEAADVHPMIRSRIVQQVRSASPAVKQVYTTTNPEYLARMETYRDASDNGHPIGEFTAEFNALAARIFPAVTYMDDAGSRSSADRHP